MKPLAIDLYCGLGGWSEGLLAEGFDVVGFDIERHRYPRMILDNDHGGKSVVGGSARGPDKSISLFKEKPRHFRDTWKSAQVIASECMEYPGQLVVQDVLTLHGRQFKDAALIVASPPCQEYSYMAMPWKRAKAKAAAIRADTTGRMLADLNRLFDACFRIQMEASIAAGRHVPMVVENVRGAIPWVGRSRWNFGSFHLWGDVPALMPTTGRHIKQPGDPSWFYDNYESSMRRHSSKSPARKAASAMIAKIPLPLARHIAAVYRPRSARI